MKHATNKTQTGNYFIRPSFLKRSGIGLMLSLAALLLWTGTASANCTKVPTPLPMYQIAAGSTQFWAVDYLGNVYQYDVDTFNKIDGHLFQIAIGEGNNVWGINPNDNTVWQYIFPTPTNPGGFAKRPGSLLQISVGGTQEINDYPVTVWGVGLDHQLYYWGGTSFVKYTQSDLPPGGVQSVAVGFLPWILDANYDVWLFEGEGYGFLPAYAIKEYGDQAVLSQISAGPSFAIAAWGIDSGGNVWQLVDADGAFEGVPGAKLSQISTFSNTTAWGVDASGHVYEDTGSGFVDQCPGGPFFASVSAGSAQVGTWGLTATGDVYIFQ